MPLEFGSKVLIMGILNVTPDSFSDGGRFLDPDAIGLQVDAMLQGGADIIDVGGESTRPFASPVPAEDELDRVLPAIRLIRQRSALPISIDTTKAEVARKALAEGADIINDISALRFDPAMLDLVKEKEVPVIIMHMQGNPADMQLAPHYDDVISEIKLRGLHGQLPTGLQKNDLLLIPALVLARLLVIILPYSDGRQNCRSWAARYS